MPNLVRLTDTYNLGGGVEKAQTTLWFFSPTGASVPAFATALAPLIDTRWNSQVSLCAPLTSLYTSKLDLIDISTGHVLSTAPVPITPSTPGTSSSGSLPYEVAEVLTLRTATAGASFRGRIYMPPFSVTRLTNDGNLASSGIATCVAAWATFFTAVNALSTDWVAGVYSRKNRAFTPIISIDMGNVADVMRSRRRSLVEVRQSATV